MCFALIRETFLFDTQNKNVSRIKYLEMIYRGTRGEDLDPTLAFAVRFGRRSSAGSGTPLDAFQTDGYAR